MDIKKNRAVFLDRDGTINIEKDYLIETADFEFIPCVPEALKQLQQAGFLLVVVTNQSGIARGYFNQQQVENLHHHLGILLESYGVDLAGIYYCPHHPTVGLGEYLCDCQCRKGKPGMLLKAAKELNIDLSKSFMIGDKYADIQAGCAAGCETYLVKTGHGQSNISAVANFHPTIVADLPAAAAEIVTNMYEHVRELNEEERI